MVSAAYRDEALMWSNIFCWYGWYHEGQKILKTTSGVAAPLILEGMATCKRFGNCCHKIVTCHFEWYRMSVNQQGYRTEDCHWRRRRRRRRRGVCSHSVPLALTAEQVEDWEAACPDLIEMSDSDPDSSKDIVAGDESWRFAYDPATKQQSSVWVGENSLPLQKLWFQKSQVKNMLVIYDWQGVMHKEFVPEGQIVNCEFYREAMDRNLKRLRRVRPDKAQSGNWFLLHNNAPSHKSSRSFSHRKALLFFTIPLLARFSTCGLLSTPYYCGHPEYDEWIKECYGSWVQQRHLEAYDHVNRCTKLGGMYVVG